MRTATLLGASLLVTDCSTLPPLSHATNNLPFAKSIPVDEIVQRVKCDLSEALYEKVYYGPDSAKLKWMQNWTAKSDLTLEANETGGVTPNIAFIQPLKSAFFLGGGPSTINSVTGATTNVVGATMQNFTLGIGGTYSGQVTRTQTLSFTVSLAELKYWKQNSRSVEFCTPSGATDLQQGLDLKSWLDEALRPAITGELKTGIHPDPGSAKSAATVSASPSAPPTRTANSKTMATVPPPKFPLSAEGKARRDLQLATALTALGVPYNLDQFNPAVANDKSFCTTVYPKAGPHVPLMNYKPPAFLAGTSSNNPTLEMQATAAAQNAYASANQAVVSPILREGIKKEAEEAADNAARQAVQVERAAPFAKRYISAYCQKNGLPYLKPGGTCDVLPTPTFAIGGAVRPGDTVTAKVMSGSLPGGSQSVTYTVLTGETAVTIASKLADAINDNSVMQGATFLAKATANVVRLTNAAPVGEIHVAGSTSDGALETITTSDAPKDTPESYVVVPFSPQFCDRVEYDNYLKRFFQDQFNSAQDLTVKAQENATLAKSLTAPDPPVESIGQSMSFIITAGLSTTPNWTYLH